MPPTWQAGRGCALATMRALGSARLARLAKDVWLRAALIEAAHASSRARSTYLGALYRRLVTRRGKKKAAVAVGHAVLVIAYHLLKRKTEYIDLGAEYFDQHDEQYVARRLVDRLEALGYSVQIERPAA